MSKVNQLKNKARREEQRENWSKAIELYTQALDVSRKEGEAFADLSLYNRIGDIYLRIGQKNTAVRYYEQAIERYADQDLHTSAIALCNKVLRIHPERSTVFLQLGRLHLATNLIADARAHYHRYAEAMRERGTAVAAFEALEELIDETGDTQTITLWVTWLSDHPDKDEALERVEEVRNSLIGHGIGPDSIIEQVRTGEIAGVEVAPVADAEPDPLAGAFLSTPDAPVVPQAEPDAEPLEAPDEALAEAVPAEVEVDDVEIDADAIEPLEALEALAETDEAEADETDEAEADVLAAASSEDTVELPALPDFELFEAADHAEPTDESPDVAPIEEEAVDEPALSAAEEVTVPEPAPLELGSVQWTDEAEELLAELNQPLEAAWEANGDETHDAPPVHHTPLPAENEVEGDEPPTLESVSHANEPEPLESVESPRAPRPSRPWIDSADLTELEVGSLPDTQDASERPYGPESREPDSTSYADAVLGVDTDLVSWETAEGDTIAPAPMEAEVSPLSFEDVEFDAPVEWPVSTAGFSAEPPMEDDVPEPAGLEPSEPALDATASNGDAGTDPGALEDGVEESVLPTPEIGLEAAPIHALECAEAGEPIASTWGNAGVDPETTEVNEISVENWEEEARAALEEATAVPEPEPIVEVEPEPVAEVEPEPVAEVEPEPVAEVEPEPVAEVEPEPVAEVEPEPVAEVEPEPVAEVEPEPVVEVEPEPVVEYEPEPVVEFEPEPVVGFEPEPEIRVEPTADPHPAGEVEVRAVDDDVLPVVNNPFAPPSLPDIPTREEAAAATAAAAAAAESETMMVEVPTVAEPVVDAPTDPAVVETFVAEPVQAEPEPSPSGAGVGTYDLSEMDGPLAEPRLTVEEDPEDAFRDWVQSASTGVLKRALPELENRSELEKALLVIGRLAHLEDAGVEFKTRLVETLEKLGRTEPAADACITLGSALETQGRFREAHEAYQRALRIQPGLEEARIALDLLGELGKDEPAEEAVELRPTPYMPDHVNGTDTQSTLDHRPRAAPPSNGHGNGHSNGHSNGHDAATAPRPYSGVAGGAEASADFEQLLSEFRAELHHQPGQAGATSRTELGASLKDMGRLDDAIRELQAAIREPAPPPMAFELLGEAFLEKGQGRIAIRLLEKALGTLGQSDRELMGVLYQLGVAYESLPEANKALMCYERIFSVDIDYRDIQERILACSA